MPSSGDEACGVFVLSFAGQAAAICLENGFQPNVEQSEATRVGMRALFGLAPGACYALGFFALLRFRLDEAEHAAIRRGLEQRALEAAR